MSCLGVLRKQDVPDDSDWDCQLLFNWWVRLPVALQELLEWFEVCLCAYFVAGVWFSVQFKGRADRL